LFPHHTSHQLFELELSWEDLIEKIRKKFKQFSINRHHSKDSRK